MRLLLLTRQRLQRILSVLDRLGGEATIRDLARTYGIYAWEIEQAEELGWLCTETRKPHVGRPSRVALKLSENPSAKLPPWREDIEPEISFRHWRFAANSIASENGRGYFGFSVSRKYTAYLRTYPNARSHAGASASASRLLKRADVRAVRMWLYAKISQEIPRDEPMPTTTRGILKRLLELENWLSAVTQSVPPMVESKCTTSWAENAVTTEPG